MGLAACGEADSPEVAAWDGTVLDPALELAPAFVPAVALPGAPKPYLARTSWPVLPVSHLEITLSN